jgi:hypothetical protein
MNMRGFSMMLAAAGMVAGFSAAAAAVEGKPIDCSDTSMNFEASGYQLACKDYSDPVASTGGQTFALKRMTLHALSEREGTFLDAIDDHILGTTRVFYHKTSLENDIGRYFTGNFTQWSDSEDVGDFDVKHFSATFENDKSPVDCVAFRRLGGRRFSGVGGMTVGIACSQGGRAQADDALKHFSEAN